MTCSACREPGQPVGVKRWRRVFHEDNIGHALTVWAHAIDTKTPYSLEYRIRGKDGVARWFLCKGCPCHDGRGQVRYWACTV